MENRRRNKGVFIRMDEQHHKKWQMRVRKSGISQADLFEKIVDNVMIVNVNQFTGLMKELKYQGNNLNQMTKSIHLGEMIPNYEVIKKLNETQKVYREVMESIASSVNGFERKNKHY